MTTDSPAAREIEAFAAGTLAKWALPLSSLVKLINVSENHTCLIDAGGARRYALRIHRPGYHCLEEIQSEVAWVRSLAESGLIDVPSPIPGIDGKDIQSACPPGGSEPRFLVMFDFLDGEHPDENEDLAENFEALGRIAAKAHLHSMQWHKPAWFTRPAWDLDAILGNSPRWGDWRKAPNVTAQVRTIVERAESVVRNRVGKFGTPPGRYGLIHADMRLANLIINNGTTYLIDFDDCGWGWLLYDFAAGVSFIEDSPQLPELKAAWLQGYRSGRPLSADDAAEIDSFVMLRRLALLAWIGTRSGSTEPQKLAPGFAAATAELAEGYLLSHG